MAYGAGGGSYDVCLDVGSTLDCVNDSLNAVFTHFFGSYFGDWDTKNNFLRALLANKGGGLSASWSGRPWHYYHLMGAGEPLGETARINLFNTSERRLHLHSFHGSVANAFLGDPSLRMHYFRPPGKPIVQRVANRVELRWSRSPERTVTGYHVYRAVHADSTWKRLTTTPIQDTIYRDSLQKSGTYHYMVRGFKTQAYPGGTYPNLSLGAMAAPVSVLVAARPRQSPHHLTISPNPTHGRVRIEAADAILQVEVVDELGRSMLLKKTASRSVEVDMMSLPRGVYTVKVLSGGEWQMKRVVRL